MTKRDEETIAARWPPPTGATKGRREKQSRTLGKGKGEERKDNGTQSTGSEQVAMALMLSRNLL